MNTNDQKEVDETLSRLISMTNSTCLALLDKSLNAINRQARSYAIAASFLSRLGEQSLRCVKEVKPLLKGN